MKVEAYNTEGKSVGLVTLPERLFGMRWNAAVVKQVYDGELANRRRPWAHVKDRSEVRGGGRKPWRQKGLGRARHGSIRSPIWIGGGVSHGPRKDRDFSVKINKKMKNVAIKCLLSSKLKENSLILIDNFTVPNNKTKETFLILKRIQDGAKTTELTAKSKILLAISHDDGVIRATRNIKRITYIEPRNINTTSLLHSKYLILDKNAITELEKTFK